MCGPIRNGEKIPTKIINYHGHDIFCITSPTESFELRLGVRKCKMIICNLRDLVEFVKAFDRERENKTPEFVEGWKAGDPIGEEKK